MLDTINQLLGYIVQHPHDMNAITLNALIAQIKKDITDGNIKKKFTGIQIWSTRRSRFRNLAEIVKLIMTIPGVQAQIQQATIITTIVLQENENLSNIEPEEFWRKLNQKTPRIF